MPMSVSVGWFPVDTCVDGPLFSQAKIQIKERKTFLFHGLIREFEITVLSIEDVNYPPYAIFSNDE
jgi:hypothetical protein